MSCDVGKATEGLGMCCDVGEVTESLENEQSYVTVHSPTLLSLLLRHWLFTYVTWRAAHYSYPIDVKFWLYTVQYHPEYLQHH